MAFPLMSSRNPAAMFIVALAMLPIAAAAFMMCTHWVPLPYWDPWHTPGEQIASWCKGTLTLAEMFSQHNEHRPFFPRLVNVPMAAMFGWDVRREMALGFLLLCAGSAAIYVLLRHTIDSRNLRLLAFALMNLLIFTPRQYDNLVSGAEGGSFLPSVALLWALAVNLSSRPLATKTVCNAALAFVSTFTFGNGMLLWPLAFPIRTVNRAEPTASERRAVGWRLAYVAAATASIGAYFISYQHPPLAPAPAHLFADFPGILHFVARWLGALFLTDQPAVIGTTAQLMFFALALFAFLSGWRSHYPWLVLGLYVFASGLITARARLGFTLEMAADWRYTAFTVFFHVALVGLAASVCRDAIRARSALRPALVTCASVYLITIVSLSAFAFSKQRVASEAFKEKRERLRAVVQRSLTNPADPEMKLLSPYPETPQTIRTLADCGVLWPIVR